MRTLLPLLLVLVAADASAASPVAREVVPSSRGPQRLELDARALARLPSADLRELRLHAADGTEIPFLAIDPSPTAESFVEARSIAAIPVTKTTSGFEADFGVARPALRVRIDGLPAPLLKRYRMDVSADRVHWTTVIPEGTLFDLPDEDLRLMTATFEPTPLRFVRVTWNDASSARLPLPAGAALGQVGIATEEVTLREPLLVTPRRSEPRTTRLGLELPAAGIPLRAIVVETSKPRVRRPARVLSEPQLASGVLEPATLGSGTLRRSTQGGLIAEEMSIALEARPPTDRIELVIDDGDEAPLKVDRIVCVIGPLPFIWFESPDGAPISASFDASRDPPRYDLEAERAAVATTRPTLARWGDWRSPHPDEAQPVTAAPLPAGGAFDDEGYAFRRPVAMASGLVSLLLDDEVLSLSPRLADVRLVGADGQQIPFVSELRDEPLRIALPPLTEAPAGDAAQAKGTRRLILSLPRHGMPEARLALTVSPGTRIFDRTVRVVEERPGHDRRAAPVRHVLATDRWLGTNEDEPAPALVLALPGTRSTELFVEIDEGDNAPLPLERPELLIAQRRLRFVHPGTAVSLWFGAPGVAPPRYDMALLAPRVLAERATDIELAPTPAAVLDRDDHGRRATIVLWVVLGCTLVALAVVLVRLTRKGPGEAGSA